MRSDARTRIWITGIGIVSPLGAGAKSTMDRLCAGARAQRTVTLFDTTGCRSSIAAEVDLRVADVAPKDGHWSRTDAMAVLAAREALAQARLDPSSGVDLVVGTTTAGMFETEELLAALHRDPSVRPPLPLLSMHPLSAPGDRLCEALGRFNRATTVCSACSTGNNVLVVATSWLLLGRSQRVLAGAADGLCRLTFTGFSSLAALSPEPCRPFDARRDGLNLGEGAAFLLLETEASARARGSEPIAELLGWAAGAEAHHITNPEPSGRTAAEVMRRAIARAGLAAEQIDYVNAHGTATRLNDAMESAALVQCFGPRAAELCVSSSKGAIGHTLAAAGAIEAAITALVVARGELPPTAGLQQIAAECRLGHILDTKSMPIDAAMSSSFGFGGSDVVVVLAKPSRFEPPAAAVGNRVVVSAAATVGALGVRDATGSLAYLHGDSEPRCTIVENPPPQRGEGGDPADHLDADRARRLDRAGRLVVVAVEKALSETAPATPAIGAIVGGAFGSIDDCAAFVQRFLDKGARFATPAAFPSLLPSSPAAHASIYLRLRGAVLSTHDLGTTAESAIVTAIELIAAGEAERIAAGGVEPRSAIAPAVLASLAASPGERGSGTAVLLLQTDGEQPPLAEVAWWRSWRGGREQALRILADLPAPADIARAWLVSAKDEPSLPVPGPWSRVERRAAARIAGSHEAAGGFAAAAAIGAIASGLVDEALLVGALADRGHAVLFRHPHGEGARPR